jgi:hypothetical protein
MEGEIRFVANIIRVRIGSPPTAPFMEHRMSTRILSCALCLLAACLVAACDGSDDADAGIDARVGAMDAGRRDAFVPDEDGGDRVDAHVDMDAGTDAGSCATIGDGFATLEWSSIVHVKTCQYFSSRYRFTETLTGTWEGTCPPVFRGTYSYAECEVQSNRLCVETGFPPCTISADVVITLVPEEPPPPTDAGTDAAVPDHTAVCEAYCAAQRAVAEGTACTVAEDCVTTCLDGLAPGTICLPQARAFTECLGTEEGAMECDDFFGEVAPVFFGPCQTYNDIYFTCLTRPEPMGLCAAPVPDPGTVLEGEPCDETAECVPGLWCDGPTCDGEGTCQPQPVREDCFAASRDPVCPCEGVTTTRCFAAAVDVRVASEGACPMPDAGTPPD